MWRLTIENIAGIRSGTATIQPGVNAVRASNWRGKSSLLAAIETALGTATPLTEGTESGRVELDGDDRTLVTELRRTATGVVREGDVLLTDERDRTCAALFAVLGESNDVRRAVREGEDLEALLTRPLDLENVDERLAELRAERERVDRELNAAESAAAELATAEARVTELEATLADLREERQALAAAAGADADLADRRETLSSTRAARDRAAGTVERLEDQIDDLESRLQDRRDELDGIDVPTESVVTDELEETQERLAAVESEVDLLQTVYNANRRVLDENNLDLLTDVERRIDGDDVECWVCGNRAERSAVADRLDAISAAIADRRDRIDELRDDVEALASQREAISEQRAAMRDLEAEIQRIETRLADRRGDLETAIERRDRLADEVEELADEVDIADERLTDVESEIKYVEAELEDARAAVAELESEADAEGALAERREQLVGEIEALRTRRERTKRRTREAFDDAMAAVIDRFDPGFETARLTADYEIVVARDGRHVSLDALSEGEVELLGLMAALAGYEAFDVSDRVPVILLDSLGALAGENLHRLVDYFRGRATYIVTTAYPEQGGFDWNAISPAMWDVVPDAGAVS